VRKLKYCKRCGEVFESSSKFGKICDKCISPNKNMGGWHAITCFSITGILKNYSWSHRKHNWKK